jgi:hypothetical protein
MLFAAVHESGTDLIPDFCTWPMSTLLTRKSEKTAATKNNGNRGAIRPRRGVARPIDYAFAVSDSQMRILRVSGIRNRPSTKHIAGTAIG